MTWKNIMGNYNLSLGTRLELLHKYVRQRKTIVVYVFEDTKNGQFRYRYSNIESLFQKNHDFGIIYFLSSELKKLDVIIDKTSVVVVARQTAKRSGILKFIRKIHNSGTKVLFDLDDLIFSYDDLKLVQKSVQEKSWLYWAGYIWGIRRIAKRVDGFICTNEFLAKKLEQSFRKPVKVIRNSLNGRQIEVSEKYLREKQHKGFVVGYFSGSPTHTKDFGLAEPELIRFLEDHDDAKLRVVGYMNLSNSMKRLADKGRVEIVAPVDYLELQKLIAEVDVNIAPLVINDFTNCKSELKFFEAAAVETTTIASPTYAFEEAIKDGKNGFLAQPGGWYDKLEYLYNNPEKNKKIAKCAKEYALKHYYGKELLKEVESVYDYFAK